MQLEQKVSLSLSMPQWKEWEEKQSHLAAGVSQILLALLKSCRRSAIASIGKAVVSLHKQHPTIKQIGSLSSHHYINSPLPW